MSKADSLIRLVVALIIVALWYLQVISGAVMIILLIVAGIFIITGFINFCPLYAAFGIRTRSKSSE